MSSSRSIALFCATYLKPEMHHIHRQICGLKNFSPFVIAQKEEGAWVGPEVFVVPRSPWRLLARGREKQSGVPWQMSGGEVKKILALLKDRQAGLLHIFFGNVAVHLLPLLRECPIPVVISFHGSDVAGSMASHSYGEAVGEMFQLAALIPCRSEQLASQVAAMACPPEKIRVMRTVLPAIPFIPRTVPSDGGWRVLQAARFVPKKGLVTTMNAFAAFQAGHPKATLILAGEGPMEQELRLLVEKLGLTQSVSFVGFLSQSDLQKHMADSHIFLHPSETAAGDVEGIPNAMLEAMACGLPVIATHHGGIPEVISHEENGLLCREKDIEGIAEAMVRLTKNPLFYEKISRSGSESVQKIFGGDAQIENVESIYNEAIKR